MKLEAVLNRLPNDWHINPLDNLIQFISYGFTNPMPTVMSGVWMITANDINHGQIRYSTARQTSEFAYDNLLTRKSKPIKGDLLLTKDGSLGRVAVVGDEKICINQSVAVLRPNPTILDTSFLKHLLQSDFYQKEMILNAGGSTIKHIYITIVDKMLLLTPPLAEQQKIAQALTDTDNYISALEKLIEKKKMIKEGLMVNLLTGKQRLKEFAFNENGTAKGYKDSELGKIPQDWDICSLTDLATKITMGQSPESSYYNNQELGLPLIQGNADIKNRTTIIRNYTSKVTKKAFNGDLILSVRAPVGEVAKASFECCIGRGVCSIQYENDYLYYWLINFENKWDQFSKGSTFDSINSHELEKVIIHVPSKEEQIAISHTLGEFDEEIKLLELKLLKAVNIKQGMMQKLLTGEIRLA